MAAVDGPCADRGIVQDTAQYDNTTANKVAAKQDLDMGFSLELAVGTRIDTEFGPEMQTKISLTTLRGSKMKGYIVSDISRSVHASDLFPAKGSRHIGRSPCMDNRMFHERRDRLDQFLLKPFWCLFLLVGMNSASRGEFFDAATLCLTAFFGLAWISSGLHAERSTGKAACPKLASAAAIDDSEPLIFAHISQRLAFL